MTPLIPRVLSRLCFLLALAVAAAFAAASGAPADARSLDDKEKAALTATVTEFDAAMRKNDYERIVDTVPPKVINSISAKAGLDPAKLRTTMVGLMKTLTEQVKIESFGMDIAKADYKELKSGAPYALIPTETVIAAGDKGRIQQKSHTLALLDEGKWYLVRVSDMQQLMIVREVYPEFTGVEFPQGSMEVLKQ